MLYQTEALLHCKGCILSSPWGGKNRTAPANQNINCRDRQGLILSPLEFRKDSHDWEVVLLITFFPPLFFVPITYKKIKALKHYIWCCLRKWRSAFWLQTGVIWEKQWTVHCWSNVQAASSLWEPPKQRFGTEWANLPAAAVLRNQWEANSSLLSLMWTISGGKELAKDDSQPFLLQKYRGSHGGEYVRPL